MKNRRAGAIGLLSSWDAGSFVFPPIISGVQAICSENDLGVVICTGKADKTGCKDYISYYLQNRIDALIYLSYVGVGYDGVIKELADHGIPFVCIIGARDIPSVSCVDVSFLESGYMAGRHLVEAGYEKIGYILTSKVGKEVYAERERYEGCKAAVLQNGSEFIEIDSLIDVDWNDGSFLENVEKVLEARHFDAVVACSYQCFTVLKAAAGMGIKVPYDLGVISLDNEAYAPYLYPSLTTIDEPLREIAENAMSILLESMKGTRLCRKLEIAPKLSIRESTRKRNNECNPRYELRAGSLNTLNTKKI
jgi:LacI family transcriptional regulator